MRTSLNLYSEIAHLNTHLRERLVRLDEMLPCKPGEEHCQHCDGVRDCMETINDAYMELMIFMQTHFSVEAKAMQLLTYRQQYDTEAHHEDHANLMQKLIGLAGKTRLPVTERVALKQSLDAWQNAHFVNYDEQLIAALRQV
jgi:hemerythrin